MVNRRVRSSIRAVHLAIMSLKTSVHVTVCGQPPRTNSFRGLGGSSGRSIYYTLSSAVGSAPASPAERFGRFFFSPRTTKYIMEEMAGPPPPPPEPAVGPLGFWEGGSEAVEIVASEDPYGEFRASMEEMVAANGGFCGRRRLQELLQSYLRLNDEGAHRVIVLAFVDLVVQLVAQNNGASCSTQSLM